MAFKEILKEFNEELNKFVNDLTLWIPLIKLLVMSDQEFYVFWDNFSNLHKEKKIYSLDVVERMKNIFLRLRNSEEEWRNLSEKEVKELLSFSASQKYIFS